ncbi:MAG TPA: hypothetical protein VEF04_19680 [Blastocatellia bacterium]|nr:hypothetical protein [Blastocatellia bacterium]
MPFHLTFAQKSHYDSQSSGISVEVTLQRGSETAITAAKIDTGAQFCLFARQIGEDLEINIETGWRIELQTLVGSLVAYGHEVTLEVLGLTFSTVVYFAEDEYMKRNLLGRQGWLQLVKLAIIDYNSEIYLSPYNE